MATNDQSRCAICDAPAVGTFRYRTHNPVHVPSEPFCVACATVTKRTACVANMVLAEPVPGTAD